ncbi:unnamed protein product, partial [Vitis vinifera]
MGNCLTVSSASDVSKKRKSLAIETSFKLPAPMPTWPPGEGFAGGTIDLGGGLEVCQISSFTKVWATHEGGPDNLGATFFEPSPMPEEFCMLGCYSQPNKKPLFGWVLAGKDNTNNPLDGNGYVWLPTPPDGYKAVGHVITNLPEKPSLDKIRCVRSDLTDLCEADTDRGAQALANISSNLYAMPNLAQVDALVQAYSPWVYLHPDEQYLPSSVSWFFQNGALLYQQGEESKPVNIDPTGSNLPQGGSNDGAYWLDLPVDAKAKETVKKGDLQDSMTYMHIKPMLGATFTDIAIWIFYPFNGPARAKVELINISLGKIGEHVGDWEHVTLRVSNFNGKLMNVFFSEHSSGTWVNASELEFQNGNKVVSYASLHGHAFYPKPGLVLQGSGAMGIRNDTAKSKMVMDTGTRYIVVAAEYLGSAVVEPPWLNYYRKWGPKIRPTGPKMKKNWDGDEV